MMAKCPGALLSLKTKFHKMKEKGKKFFTFGLILFLIFLWQNAEAKEKIQGEFGLGVVLSGIYGEYRFGEMVSIGASKGGWS